MQKVVLESKLMDGTRARGHQRLKFIEGLALATGTYVVKTIWKANDQRGFRFMVANVRF